MYTTGTAQYARHAGDRRVVQAVGIARAARNGYWVAIGPSGPPLPPNSGTGRRIVYSNAQQRIWLVEANGVVSHTYLVSGRHGLPSVGVHQVYSKVTSLTVGRPDPAVDAALRGVVERQPDRHPRHPTPARRLAHRSRLAARHAASHGCLRMAQGDAKFVWDWSSIGTTVVVTDLG